MQFLKAFPLILLCTWMQMKDSADAISLESQDDSFLESNHEVPENRSSRQFYFRTVETVDCTARIGELLVKGICDTVSSCALNAGEVVGFCTGNAICCLVKTTCDEVASTRVSYFVSPGLAHNPGIHQSVCDLKIRPFKERKTCQIKLDFALLELAPPTANGVCSDESFAVTGSDPNYAVPTICGDNSDQHMYLKFSSYGGEILLKIRSSNKKWVIKVEQKPCTPVTDLAPDGCLQFFNNSNGNVNSFGRGASESHNLANQNYDICLRPLTPNCSYEWTPSKFDITHRASLKDPIAYSESECLGDDYVSVLSATIKYLVNSANPALGVTTQRSNVVCGQDTTSPATLKQIQSFHYNRMRVFFNDKAEGAGFTFNYLINCSYYIITNQLQLIP